MEKSNLGTAESAGDRAAWRNQLEHNRARLEELGLGELAKMRAGIDDKKEMKVKT